MEFKCTQCAGCCTNFASSKDGGVSMFEWEKNVVEQRAKQRNLSLIIEPFAIYPVPDGYVAYEYMIKNPSCPFLKDKQCTIYHDRPLTCRLFPLRFLRYVPNEDKFVFEVGKSNGHDQTVLDQLTTQTKKLKILQDYFGTDVLVSGLQSQFSASRLIHLLKRLGAGESVTYDKLTDEQKATISIEPLFTHCKKKNIISREWVKEFIHRHENKGDAHHFLQNKNIL